VSELMQKIQDSHTDKFFIKFQNIFDVIQKERNFWPIIFYDEKAPESQRLQ
jgi:hypothetical protein